MTYISDHNKEDLIDQTSQEGFEFFPWMMEDDSCPEDKVTTKQFVTMVIGSCKGEIKPINQDRASGYIEYAISKGIIEDYDKTNLNNPIERRSVARIVHNTLRIELLEKDDLDWSAAEKLLDLYSCRTCVSHITQVYVKGIMDSGEHNFFDVKGNLSISEAAAIVMRIHDRNRRIPKMMTKSTRSKSIQPADAWDMMENNHKLILMDVRTYEEYKEGHIDGSICMPLQDIINNPFSVCNRKDTPIILYCQKGYKSTLAAQILIDAGYHNIYTIPGIEQYSYELVASKNP